MGVDLDGLGLQQRIGRGHGLDQDGPDEGGEHRERHDGDDGRLSEVRGGGHAPVDDESPTATERVGVGVGHVGYPETLVYWKGKVPEVPAYR